MSTTELTQRVQALEQALDAVLVDFHKHSDIAPLLDSVKSAIPLVKHIALARRARATQPHPATQEETK